MTSTTSSAPAAARADRTLLALLKAPPFIDLQAQRSSQKPQLNGTASAPSLPPALLAPSATSSPSAAFSPSAFLDRALPHFSPTTSLSSISTLRASLQRHSAALEAEQSALVASSAPVFAEHSALLAQQSSSFHTLTSSYSALRGSLRSDLAALSPLTSSLSSLLSTSTSIQRAHIYLLLVDQCNGYAEVARQQSDAQPQLAAKTLLQLSRMYAQVKDEGKRGARVEQLERLLHHRLLHLLHITKAKLIALYTDTLTALHWPQTAHALLETTNDALMTTFTDLTETLLLLQVECDSPPLSSLPPSPSPPSPPPSLWVFELLFSPVHVRFAYHFTGDKPTNRLDKPEWYLSFVTNVLTLHLPFLAQHVQPILLRSPLAHVDASFALLTSLLGLIREHVTASLPALMTRPVLFRHTVDELLSFEGRLRGSLEYPEQCEGVVSVLAGAGREAVFERWLSVDKEWVNDRLNAMREMKDPWQRVTEGREGEPLNDDCDVDSDDEDVAEMTLDTDTTAVDADEDIPEPADGAAGPDVDASGPSVVVTRSAHLLVSLVSSITDRFTLLPSLSARLRFVQDLQYQLLDIYLEWLEEEGARLLPALSSTIASPSTAVRTYCMVVNSIHYVESVLQDWSDSVTFIELRYFQAHSDLPASLTVADLVDRLGRVQGVAGANEVDGGVFDAMIQNYHDGREKMVKGIVDAVIDCFEALTRTYRRLGHQDVTGDEEPLTAPPLSSSAVAVGSAAGMRLAAPPLSVSASFVPALLTLKLQLLTFSRHLSAPLFALVWQRVATRLDFFLFATVIRDRYFSASGAAQLIMDLHALLLLFKPWTPSPGKWMAAIGDACALLGYRGKEREEMEREMESLEGPQWVERGEEERRRAWRERWRIRKLTEDEVHDILQRRGADDDQRSSSSSSSSSSSCRQSRTAARLARRRRTTSAVWTRHVRTTHWTRPICSRLMMARRNMARTATPWTRRSHQPHHRTAEPLSAGQQRSLPRRRPSVFPRRTQTLRRLQRSRRELRACPTLWRVSLQQRREWTETKRWRLGMVGTSISDIITTNSFAPCSYRCSSHYLGLLSSLALALASLPMSATPYLFLCV